MGQASTLQSVSSLAPPGQSSPPLAGLGLVQVRDRDCLPPPHDTEHRPYPDHELHAPSTVTKIPVCLRGLDGAILRIYLSPFKGELYLKIKKNIY